MPPSCMQLKILLPSRIFGQIDDVTHIVAQTRQGSFGILPHRLDCVATLAPSILSYATETEGDVYVAIDQGVLAKMGAEVLVSVRHAIGGADLGELRQAVEREFLTLDDREKIIRTAMAQLESVIVRRFAEFHHA
ncbi:MAG: F0F1 ATP synthase subunit epsilon [Chthoniobacterales bacterium]